MTVYVRRVWWSGVSACLGSAFGLFLTRASVVTVVAAVVLILLGTAWVAQQLKERFATLPPMDAAPMLVHAWPIALLAAALLGFALTLLTTDLVLYSVTGVPLRIDTLVQTAVAVTYGLEAVWMLTWPRTHSAHRERRRTGLLFILCGALFGFMALR